MPLQLAEAFLQVIVIVQRQRAGIGIEREGAQGATQPGELGVQLLRMGPPRLEQVTQRREARVDGVRQPKAGDVPRGVGGDIRLRIAPLADERITLRLEDLDHPSQALHEAGAGTQFQHGGDEIEVVHEVSRAVPTHSREGERHDFFTQLGIEQQPQILAAQQHRLLVLPGRLVSDHARLGHESQIAVTRARLERAVRPPRAVGRDGEQHDVTVLGGRKQLTNRARRRGRIRFRNVKGEPVGHHAPGVNDGHGTVPQGFRIQLTSRESVRAEEQLR